jgi:hypothetical protein
VASLQTQEVEARQHAGEAKKIVLYLSERARKDGEEAAQVKNERDELRLRDAEACQWILDLQRELEKEKVTALEAKAHQDAMVAERLRMERDDSCQIETRLRGEHDGARRERDGTQ